MTATITGYWNALDYMVRNGYFYDNRVPQRCQIGWKGRDCSTFNQFGLANGGFANVNLCDTSFGIAAHCYNTPRDEWFVEKFGGGLPGTFITYDQAMATPSVGFRGSDWGRQEDSTGDGHIEEILGKGKMTVGAHSHATGIGYDTNGIDNHQLSYFAVLPWFLPEMKFKSGDQQTIEALEQLDLWLKYIAAHPLEYGQNNWAIGVLVQLLVKNHYLRKGVSGQGFGSTLQTGIYKFKIAHGLTGADGRVNAKNFSLKAAQTLLGISK